MFTKRGRIEIRKNGQQQPIWGDVKCQSTERDSIGNFITESGIVPFGTVVEILIPSGGCKQSFTSIGTWKFFDHQKNAGRKIHTIQRIR